MIYFVLLQSREVTCSNISSNSFSGEMPPALNMISLYFVNISFNQFTGKLPTSWMRIAASYLESFLGNPELCLLDNDARYCKDVREGHARGLVLHVLVGVVIGVVSFVVFFVLWFTY